MEGNVTSSSISCAKVIIKLDDLAACSLSGSLLMYTRCYAPLLRAKIRSNDIFRVNIPNLDTCIVPKSMSAVGEASTPFHLMSYS